MLVEDLIPDINLESKDIEFKGILEEGTAEGEKSREIGWLKTIAAFANTCGGRLFVGVEDKSHKIVALDHNTADRIILMVHRQIRNRVTPLIDYDISYVAVPETKPARYILCISVPACRNLPVSIHEKGLLGIYVRNFGRTDLATPEQIREMILQSDSVPYDQPFTDIPFSWERFQVLKDVAAQRGVEITEKELISKRIISESGKISKGALLFTDDCSDSRTRTVATVWPGTTKGSSVIIASEEYQGNLLDVLEKAIAFVKNHSVNGFRKEAEQRIDYFSFPARSVTEGIMNAIGHRNYFMQGTQIEINLFRDRMEITSPGSLLGVRELKKEKNIAAIIPRRRNEVICAILDICRYMEEKGSGFDKIASDYAGYEDKFQPYITADAYSFTLTLPDLTYQEGVLDAASTNPPVFVEGVTQGRHDEAILSFCYTAPRTVREIAGYLGQTPSTYLRNNILRRLADQKFLLEIRDNKILKYRSNPERVKLKN